MTVYFLCTDLRTKRIRHFSVWCDAADEIRVWPDSFGKLRVEKAPPLPLGTKLLSTKRRSLVRFGDMHIIGYGFKSIYIPVGG